MPKQLELYRAGASGRINLGGLVDAEFYQAEKDPDGVITLTPVNIIAATGRRPAADDVIYATSDDDPFGE